MCIGALVASRAPEGWRVDALGAPHTGERPEAQLIRDFIEKIGQLRPQLITFNGHSFDLPVLRYRAMVNPVSAAGLQVRQYFHRYTEAYQYPLGACPAQFSSNFREAMESKATSGYNPWPPSSTEKRE